MIEDDSGLLQNKRYDKCSECNQIIVYDTEAIDRQGNLIPLDIDRKRHHCNSAQQIAYEEKIVQEIQESIEGVNRFELRFRLGLMIEDDGPDEKSTSSHMPHLSSSSEGHYKATKIEKLKRDEVKADE
jgi:hypothetical protein